MKKDYKKWSPLKKRINNTEGKRPFFHEREIWFCHLGENVGFEQDGRGEDFLRPVIILRKFNNEIFWAIPLTKAKVGRQRNKKAEKYYFSFSFAEGVTSVAILSQIRLVDAKRLRYQGGEISAVDFQSLKEKLTAILL
jgi:mRNA interferase MazF